MIRVLIADDHGLVRAGLEQLITAAEDLEVVGAATGGREAVELAERLEPAVVLMDLSMPDLDGIAATQEVLRRAPGSCVVVLTSFSDRTRILDALDAGAIGYLLKDGEPDELLRGIRAASRGESPLSSKAAQQLIASRRRPERAEAGLHVLLDHRDRPWGLAITCLPDGSAARLVELTVREHLPMFPTLEEAIEAVAV